MPITPNDPASFEPSFNPADYSQNMGQYNNPGAFRFWCQKVLPLVYDDSLSYYELLCKVVEYLNETMEDVATAVQDVADLNDSFNSLQAYTNATFNEFKRVYDELQGYVNSYFNTLDVQQEINNKLDAMVINGTFDELLAPYMQHYQDELDLMKARLTVLENDYTAGGTTADAALNDIKVGYNAKIWDTPGDAVRGQINDVFYHIDNITEETANLITCETGRFYVNASGNIQSSSNNYYGMSDTIPATEAVTVEFWDAFESGNAKIYSAWYDSEKTFIERNEITKALGATYTTLTPPTGGAYVTCAIYKSGGISANTKMMIVAGSTHPSYYIYNLNPVDIEARRDITALETYGLQIINDTYTDLDDFTVPGAIVSAYSKEYTHAPNAETGTRLILNYPSYSGSIRYQMYYNHSKGQAFTRIYSSGSWGDWQNSLDNELAFQIYNDVYTDLNDFTGFGAMVTAYSKEYTNAPNAKHGTRVIMNFNSYSGALRYQFYYNHSQAEAFTRIYSSNSWGDWKSLFKNLEDKLNSWNQSKESTSFSNDYFSSAEAASNTGTKVRIMEYNVAQYDNDTSAKIDTLPDKVINFKKLIMHVNADIIGTCEDAEYIDSGNTKATKNYLYYPIYKYKRGAGGAGVYTKKTPTSGGDVSLPNGGTVRRVYYPIGDKTLTVYCMHCSVTSAQIRAQQISELWDTIEADNPDYFVFLGDMNTGDTGEPATFKTFWEGKSCTLANGGFLGWLNTHKNNKALDNIVAGPGIIIEKFEVLQNWYSDLYSDHYPIYADLVLLDS